MKKLSDYIVTDSIYDKPIINEHLKSLKPKDVLRQLNNKFAMGSGMDIKVCGVSNYDDQSPGIQLMAPIDLEQHMDEIKTELDLMMWSATKYWIDRDGILYIQIEPVQANECTSYVYKDCGGILYHLTNALSAKRILKSGLRNRGHSYEKGDYRTIPTRTYFVVGEDSIDIKNAINQIRNSFKKAAPIALSHILRIDLTQYGKNLEFYHDPMYDMPNAVFAYSNIPGALITEIDINSI